MTRYILLPALALIGVNIAAANDTAQPAQLESINGILVVPSAVGKDGKPLTPLQYEVDTAGKISIPDNVIAAPLPSTYTPTDRAEAQQQQALQQVALTARMEAEQEALKAPSSLSTALGYLIAPLPLFLLAVIGIWLFFSSVRRLEARKK